MCNTTRINSPSSLNPIAETPSDLPSEKLDLGQVDQGGSPPIDVSSSQVLNGSKIEITQNPPQIPKIEHNTLFETGEDAIADENAVKNTAIGMGVELLLVGGSMAYLAAPTITMASTSLISPFISIGTSANTLFSSANKEENEAVKAYYENDKQLFDALGALSLDATKFSTDERTELQRQMKDYFAFGAAVYERACTNLERIGKARTEAWGELAIGGAGLVSSGARITGTAGGSFSALGLATSTATKLAGEALGGAISVASGLKTVYVASNQLDELQKKQADITEAKNISRESIKDSVGRKSMDGEVIKRIHKHSMQQVKGSQTEKGLSMAAGIFSILSGAATGAAALGLTTTIAGIGLATIGLVGLGVGLCFLPFALYYSFQHSKADSTLLNATADGKNELLESTKSKIRPEFNEILADKFIKSIDPASQSLAAEALAGYPVGRLTEMLLNKDDHFHGEAKKFLAGFGGRAIVEQLGDDNIMGLDRTSSGFREAAVAIVKEHLTGEFARLQLAKDSAFFAADLFLEQLRDGGQGVMDFARKTMGGDMAAMRLQMLAQSEDPSSIDLARQSIIQQLLIEK